MSASYSRFGVWALAHGFFGSRHHPDDCTEASWTRMRAQVIEAEQLGYDSTLILQHTISPQGDEIGVVEAWSAAAALAEATTKIEIIAAIKPLLYHPTVLAKMALQIEEISQGRFALNVVNAWYKPELERAGLPFPEHDRRYDYGREWLSAVTGLLSGQPTTFRGDHFSISDYRLSPKSAFRDRPALYISGESAPAHSIATDFADVQFLNSKPPSELAEMIRDLSRRPRRGQPLRFAMAAFVIARPTDREAEDELAYARELLAKDKAIADERERKSEAASRKTFQSQNANLHIGNRGGTASGLVGGYDRVAARIREFSGLGIETFMLQFQPFEAEMRRFAQEVIPRVRRLERMSPSWMDATDDPARKAGLRKAELQA